MHFAGSIVVPESVENPLKYYHNNTVKSRALIARAVDGGRAALHLLEHRGDVRIPEVSPVTEDTPTSPINPYGWSKLMTERMLADTAAAHPLNYCALRYFNVAGADPEGRSGQSTAGATHLIKVAVEAALGKRASVAVYGTDYATPDGTGVRDYIHVSEPRRRPRARARGADCRARTLADDELRLRPRLSRSRGARRGRPRHQPPIERVMAPRPRGRSGFAHFRPVATQGDAARGSPQHARSRHDRRHALAWERKLADLTWTRTRA
jgi:UDP-glucose 4-epimerase